MDPLTPKEARKVLRWLDDPQARIDSERSLVGWLRWAWRRLWAGLFALLLAAGCAPEVPLGDPDAARVDSIWYTDSIVGPRRAATLREGMASFDTSPWFDPGPAEPDSGLMWFRFRIPMTDNAGTCKNPIPDSTASTTDLYCIAWRGRKTDAGYGEVFADTFWVRRGTTVTYQRRVVCDTFLVTFKLCKGQKCGCDVGITAIVPPSTPPKPEMVP